MTDATVAVDRLQALQIALNFPTQIAFDRDFARVDRVNDCVQLFGRKILGPDIRVNVGLFENLFRVARAHAINVGQGGFDAFVAGDINSK